MSLRSFLSRSRRVPSRVEAIESKLARVESLLEAQAKRLEDLKVEGKTWMPLGHFYSPLVNPNDDIVHDRLQRFYDGDLPGCEDLCLDSSLILTWLERISRHYPEMPFSEKPQVGLRYYFDNNFFSYSDAVVLFGMLRELKPRRFVEVGSGYSSCVAMDTNDRFLEGSTEMTFIEPDPQTLLGLLPPNDPYRNRVIPQRLQHVPLDQFTRLQSGDILFLDSSHVGKVGSDVLFYLFAIFPLLAPGVVIHIHDIFYPFEYPKQWIVDENRSWNEAFYLHAFLQYNHAFRVIYFNDYVFKKHRPLLQSKMPDCLKNPGGSIWLQKLQTPSTR